MHPVHDEVLRFIADPQEAAFEDLALRIFAHQFESIAPYRRVCEQQQRTPSSIDDWRDIPAVPALAFKHLDLCCAPPEKVFLSTGTSQGAELRSRHAIPDLRLYRASAVAGMRMHLFPDVSQMRLVSLIPSAEQWPWSSLAQMASWAFEEFADGGSVVCASATGIDFSRLVEALRESERDGAPLCLLTTTSALIRFFDMCRDSNLAFRLPHGSRLMDTGGDKGADRTLSRQGLLYSVWNTLAIPGYFVVNEYGMSELSSQYYDNVLRDRVAGRVSRRAKVGPPWLRMRILDPATLRDVPPGETGLLCHTDLANAGTALVVLTEDLGRTTEHGFEVVGRAVGAESRGCSLALTEFLSHRGPD